MSSSSSSSHQSSAVPDKLSLCNHLTAFTPHFLLQPQITPPRRFSNVTWHAHTHAHTRTHTQPGLKGAVCPCGHLDWVDGDKWRRFDASVSGWATVATVQRGGGGVNMEVKTSSAAGANTHSWPRSVLRLRVARRFRQPP